MPILYCLQYIVVVVVVVLSGIPCGLLYFLALNLGIYDVRNIYNNSYNNNNNNNNNSNKNKNKNSNSNKNKKILIIIFTIVRFLIKGNFLSFP